MYVNTTINTCVWVWFKNLNEQCKMSFEGMGRRQGKVEVKGAKNEDKRTSARVTIKTKVFVPEEEFTFTVS